MRHELTEMLRYRRPAGSKTERRFIARYIANLPNARCDAFGNYVVVTDSTCPILWSAHTDTVHRIGGMQAVAHDQRASLLSLDDDNRDTFRFSNCLGADDTIGCYLLCRMVKAGVPGFYIFHRAEERGGIGSSRIAHAYPSAMKHLTMAIALDRRGTSDVITHQGWARCASDRFARSLAAVLNDCGMRYKPDDTGIFTDTANYTDVIGECTNLSVGYAHEHTPFETVDLLHVDALAHALTHADFSQLAVERKPGDDDPDDDLTNWRSYWHADDWRRSAVAPNRRSVYLTKEADALNACTGIARNGSDRR